MRDCAGLDRLQDLLVLLLEGLEFDAAFGRSSALPDRPPRDDEATEIFQETCELRISRGIADCTMECKVFVDCALAVVNGRLNGVEFVGDLPELPRGSALGGKPGGFDLNPGAQFHHVEHFAQWRSLVEID